MSQSKKQNGLPDIAESSKPSKHVVVTAIVIVIIAIIGMFINSKSHHTAPQSADETYTISAERQLQNHTEQQLPEKITHSNDVVKENVAPNSVSPEVIQQQLAMIEAKQKELHQRLIAPLMLVNTNSSNPTSGEQSQPTSKDANTQFMQQVSTRGTETATASNIGPLNTVIAEGSLIHATLESATNSDLPGNLRASVSEPVYSEDGTQVLIPRGSRLIGQYKSGMLQGQSRVFVVWTRVITPSGVSVQLGSPGVDSLGVAGLGADEINRHFWERFGNASLLSLIGAGAANVGVNGSDQNNSTASYREAVASSSAQSADQSLQLDNRIAPTLKTYQGKPIIVFVAKDLHFESTKSSIRSKTNIF